MPRMSKDRPAMAYAIAVVTDEARCIVGDQPDMSMDLAVAQ